MRAILYARVSTDDQAERGYSLPSQLDACRQYAEQHGMTIVDEFKDDYSGAKLNRPAFAKVRELIRSKSIDALVVLSSDRLTRSLAHSLILREELKQAGIELHYVRRGKSDDSAESRMLGNIEGVFDEYWREKITEAARRGQAKKAASGQVVGQGPPKFGYRYEDGRLYIVEAEAQIVRQIFNWYVYGYEGVAMTAHGIARKLSEKRILTPSEYRPNKSNRSRASCMWSGFVVRNFLACETYMGIYKHGKWKIIDGKWLRRPNSETINIPVPALVDADLWKAAERKRTDSKLKAKRNAKREYLLRGMVICSKCRYRMGGNTHIRDETHFYICCSRRQRFKGLEHQCDQINVPGKRLEDAVWHAALELLKDPMQLRFRLERARELQLEQSRPRREELLSTTHTIEGCRAEMGQYVIELTRAKGDLMRDAIGERIAALEKSYAGLLQEKDRLEKIVAQEVITVDGIEAALQFRNEVMVGLDNATFQDKRAMLELLQTEVICNKREATIQFKLPNEEYAVDISNPGN